MNSVERYESIYGKEPLDVAFCPYRICPVGAHTDHQHGKITGLAIDKGVHIAYGAKQNGVIEFVSMQFEKRAQFHVASVPRTKQNDWADYLRGAAYMLSKKHPLEIGLSGVIEGDLPIGGLSSSAAVTIAFLSALCKVNHITLSERDLIETALATENKYVGVSCGKLDQSCEVFSKKNHLLYLDTLDDSFELIPEHPDMKPYRIAIFFSGVERALTSSKYNMRVDECRSAAYALKAYSGMEYGKYEETYLRDVPCEVFETYKHKLPDTWRMRAEHWYSEMARVEKAAEAWRKGNLGAYGAFSFESGHSSIYQWETGSPELKALYDIMLKTDGIYGGRFSGAGFKGCCMALIDPAFADSIREHVTKEYLQQFPDLRDKFSVHFCESADGVTL